MTNETNLSLQVFGSALANQIDESPLDLTPAEQDQALATATSDMRKNHFNDIQNKRKCGEILYNAKCAAPGRFTQWVKDSIQLYLSTEGKEGFYIGSPHGEDKQKTVQNYINLHLLMFHHTDVYETYRHFPLWIVFQVASFTLNDKDPETVPAIQAIRAKTAGLLDDSNGTSNQVGCGLPESYIALREMCEDGSISQIAAMNIVDDADTSSDVVRDAVQLWGVRELECVEVLRNVEESILRAIANNQPYNNMFTEAANCDGNITDERGEQLPMRKMSPRELWNSHIKHRYHGVDGDDDPGNKGGAKSKKVMDTSIDRNEAIRIAQQLNNNDVAAGLEVDSPSQRYDLRLVKPLA